MRQVPHYLLIGDGCVARHFQHYFSLLHLSFDTWHRKQAIFQLHQHLEQCSHILLLISDHAIENFITEHLMSMQKIIIHCSGSLISQRAYGAHPLMCFNENVYELKKYQSLAFILDEDAPEFSQLLPGLENQHARLSKELKAKYHALCVLSGNFSCMLWQKLFASLTQEFTIPHSVAQAYLLQQTQNLLTNPNTALTGPLVRNDWATIEKNLAALSGDPFQAVYQSFITCYQTIKKEELT